MTSKYTNILPDIDDQPDVYETPDADSANQVTSFGDQSSDEDDNNENVVRSRVSIKDATARFKDSVVESTGVDFSDRLTRRKKAMYRSIVRRPASLDTTEYEMLPRELELQETPMQKLRRLMYEVQELNEHVEKSKDEAPSDVSQTDLLSQISYLQTDLARISQRLDQASEQDGASTATYGSRIDEAKQLIKQLEAYKNTPPKEHAGNDNDDTVLIDKTDKGDVVTYELFYTPEAVKMHKESKVAEIDERIAKIESLVGSSSGNGFDDLPPSLVTSSLVGSLSKLEQQIAILSQPRHLDTIKRKLETLVGTLDRLNELKSGRKDASHLYSRLPDTTSTSVTATAAATANNSDNKDGNGLSSDTEEKVKHLFDTMEKIDPLLNLTPALLTRLKALQGLHTEASTFGRSVKMISEEQSRITDELKSLSSACELLNKSLKENEDTVNANIKVIDTRMTELVQRVGALSTDP
ncbi:hypothetical protein LRAMOSA09272 [Lichtheimia ramosa]|uniref:Dynactin subunit 2 n=1 Tax=Lichtheimia ramosa TaxID=688394 RepID=A0A077WH86_9FUNG|nr:hypothetical protein LRAMOSA09272 [Lichtheimia ramosa]